jgi:hypothetical protein
MTDRTVKTMFGGSRSRRIMMQILCIVTSASCAYAGRGVTRASDGRPIVKVVRLSTPPVIDGMLDDAAWNKAVRLDDFYVPNLDRKPTERTIIWLAVDDSCIYWAARMYDSKPGEMRMEQTRRGGNVGNDDYISVGFDLDNRHIGGGEFVYRITPRGTQSDDVPDGGAEKVEWRGDWHGAARIDSLGWTAEASIPMRMFARPGGGRIIGVSACRRIPRTQERILWPNHGATWDRTKCGDWTYVKLPPQRQPPKIMPYLVGEAVDEAYDGYLGADFKWTTPGGISLAGTVYPDFKNVQNEILGLDFSYTTRLRGDNRPFFAEGSGYMPPAWIFNSGNVGEVYGGTKAFGDVGRHRFGIIQAYDRDEVNHLAGQWYWQPADRLDIWNAFTWRHGPKDAVDPSLGPTVTDNAMLISSISKGHLVRGGVETYNLQGGVTTSGDSVGHGYNVQIRYDRKPANADFGWSIRGRLLSSGFITIDGWYDEIDSDQRDVIASFGYEREYDRTYFREWAIWASTKYAQRLNGDLYEREYELEGDVDIYTGVVFSARIRDTDRPPYRDRMATAELGWLRHRLFVPGEIGVTFGDVKDTDFLRAWFGQSIHPLSALTASVRTEYRRQDYPLNHEDKTEGGVVHTYQAIGTLQYDLTTERAVSGRLIRTDDGWNGYATFQQVVRKGMDIYLIVGEPKADTWTKRVAIKTTFVL